MSPIQVIQYLPQLFLPLIPSQQHDEYIILSTDDKGREGRSLHKQAYLKEIIFTINKDSDGANTQRPAYYKDIIFIIACRGKEWS